MRVPVDVRVDASSVQFQVVRGERVERICGEAFRHKDVPVAQKQRRFCGRSACAVIFHDSKFILDGHVEHHQVDICIAVPADRDDALLVGSKRIDDPHGAVTRRERVARSVIERVAQQKNFVAVEFLEKSKRLPCGDGGTVNIGEDKCAHLVS